MITLTVRMLTVMYYLATYPPTGPMPRAYCMKLAETSFKTCAKIELPKVKR